MELGIQVSSFRPVLHCAEQVDFAFSRLQEMGCHTVQLQWIDPKVSPEEICSALRAHGLVSVSLQEIYDDFLQLKDYDLALMSDSGSIWLCLSRISERYRSREGLAALAGEWRALTEELKQQGQRLCFHPTASDYTPIDGLLPVEYLMQALPELALCPDFYHCLKAGIDIPEFLHHWAGRVCMVHFKESQLQPDGTELLIPPGTGDFDWQPVINACLETGVLYGFAEQERWQGDPFSALQQSFQALLKGLGK